ncbi:MAG: hypothetical protein GY715_00295 [Planctomycetes bacterium]|nr:hypothetical protein [Planctomycetota bacterium]
MTTTGAPRSRNKSKPKPPTHIRDARGRKVTQLDPVELRLLHRHDAIDAEALRPIADEVGSGLEERTRRFMPVLFVGVVIVAFALILQIVLYSIKGDIRAIFSPRNIALANIWFFILVLWMRAKQVRFGRIRKIMLKHRRCPHCGYDVHGLAPDEADGCTVCPECGCAWRLASPET